MLFKVASTNSFDIGKLNHIHCPIELIAVFIHITCQFILAKGHQLFQGFIAASV
jgi:hypothetical protein